MRPSALVSIGADSNERRSEEKEKARPKPHLFFVLIDDMGYNDIGYQSTDLQAVTPNLNSLAKRGVTVCVRSCHRERKDLCVLSWPRLDCGLCATIEESLR